MFLQTSALQTYSGPSQLLCNSSAVMFGLICSVYVLSIFQAMSSFELISVYIPSSDFVSIRKCFIGYIPPLLHLWLCLCSIFVPVMFLCIRFVSMYVLSILLTVLLTVRVMFRRKFLLKGSGVKLCRLTFESLLHLCWIQWQSLLWVQDISILFKKKLNPLPLPANQTLRLHSFCAERPKMA